jgi:hypothetical protein
MGWMMAIAIPCVMERQPNVLTDVREDHRLDDGKTNWVPRGIHSRFSRICSIRYVCFRTLTPVVTKQLQCCFEFPCSCRR